MWCGWLTGAGVFLAACAPGRAAPPTATPPAARGLDVGASGLIQEPPRTPLTAPPTPGRLTPVERFYLKSYSKETPKVDLAQWRLEVTGLVAQPLTLTWADVLARPQQDVMRTLECIGNSPGGNLIGNTLWRGVALRDILAAASLQPDATHIQFDSLDEYYTSVPVALALDERALLVHQMDGQPLKPGHGYPLRVLLAGVYGQKQPKWVTRLTAVSQDRLGVWERQGWSNRAEIRINARIDAPALGARLKVGQPALLAGIAFAGVSGVARVEFSVDGGSAWAEARLVPGPTPFAETVWAGWYTEWTPPAPGPYRLQVRATDGAGVRQTSDTGMGALGSAFPNGTSEIHEVAVTAEG